MTPLDTPWPPVSDMVDLRPGTVTTIASLPTVGRSTFTLNMALHAALQGTCALYTSSELDQHSLVEKTVSAMYGIDLRHKEAPLGGWDVFSPRIKTEVESLPLYFHTSMHVSPEETFREGAAGGMRRGRKVQIWFLDALAHFSEINDVEETVWDYRQSMGQLREIAHQQQIPIVVTARADNESEHDPLTLKHIAPAIAELSDQVLMLHRDGAYWTTNGSDIATVTRLKPEYDGEARLRLLPRLCRFAHFGINV
ncbi:DnaB-like helicase C-terminal domain-containing protein [Streptomyces griseoluteus]|uniref:DnaB-like helicase C-terminal domain-containing protein n=1 Tax=Streptomyces griseoluteus TaxID=29306 RepID=UPI00332B4CB5